MDKSWMFTDRLSREYEDGVESFLQYALQNARDPNLISCPCAKCMNLKRKNTTTIKAHLCCHGMDLTYDRWIWHGEKIRSTNTVNEAVEMGQNDQHDEVEDQIEMVHDAYETYQDNPAQFRKLLEDAEKPLYPGNKKFTKLSTIVKLYNLKAKHGWSDTSFNDLLALLGEMLPDCNELPSSLYDAKKSLCTLGMSYEKIHACKNDCILYRKMYMDLTSCPTCGESRWKVSKTNKENVKVPAKVLWYFPPKPRFLRMFRNKEIAKELTWHADKRRCDGFLRHPADAPAWRLIDHKWPDFASENRNLRLALSADGINPHSSLSSKYSCWPVTLVTYNLPPWLCMKRKFIMLTLLISGPNQPGNDIDVYLSPLIDDLKELWDIGIQAFDAYREESFMLKAVLLWTINDFPAYGNLSGCCVKGYLACPVCGENTYATWLKHGRKMSYTGHRRFLPHYHPYRRQKKAFNGLQEFETAPKPLNGHEVLEKVNLINCSWGKPRKSEQNITNPKSKQNKSKKRKKIAEPVLSKDTSCWKKKSIFFDLVYWEHLHIRHVLDVMHIEKNVCESLIGTLLNIPGKTKDGIASRMDLVDMGVRCELAPKVGEKRTFLPPACYTLSKEEKKKLCNSFFRMKVPSNYSSNVASLISMADFKMTTLKSHDCHTLMQHLIPVAIRGVLTKHVRYSITKLCFFFNVLCSKVIDVSKLDEIQSDVVQTLCLLEKHFPPSFFDIMVHLVVHLVREVKLCGPVWYRWMYPFERFMKILKGSVRNRNRPEGSIAECYIAEEAVEFCADYLSNVQTIGISSSQRVVDRTKPLSGAKLELVGDEEWDQAHRYVLMNSSEIEPYIEEHKAHLKTSFPKAKTEKWFQDEHNRTFVRWLHHRIASASTNSTDQISTKLKWLAHGPSKRVLKYQSYMIDGVTYHTMERDEIRTVQNSGVSLVAEIMQVSSAKDKNPIVSNMLFYGRIEEIWELDYQTFHALVFKCKWVESNNGVRVDDLGFTLVNLTRIGYKSDSFILGSQAKQVFYIEDPQDPTWSIVLASPSKDYLELIENDELGDVVIHHQCFTTRVPTMDLNDETDENEPSCVRRDCDGTWLDNNAKS